MAANQTIIQAAGQRYAPTKIDYSGYIQGISSVATALIEKKNNQAKNKAALNDLLAGTETDITPWGDIIKSYIDQSPDSIETKQQTVERMKKGTLKLEDLKKKMAEMIEQGLTESLDPDVENWIRSYAAGEFDQVYSVAQPVYNDDGVQIGTKMQEFNMNFGFDENFNPMVIGPKGDPITMDEFENLLSVPSASDGDEVISLIEEFPTLSGVKPYKDGTKPPDDVFMGEYRKTLGMIKKLFKSGTDDVSGENVMTAFMFDSSFVGKDGEDANFIDWYLSREDLFPDDFKKLYGEYRKEYAIGSENEKKMLNIIAQDLIKNDPNIKDDLMKFIEATLNEYK